MVGGMGKYHGSKIEMSDWRALKLVPYDVWMAQKEKIRRLGQKVNKNYSHIYGISAEGREAEQKMHAEQKILDEMNAKGIEPSPTAAITASIAAKWKDEAGV